MLTTAGTLACSGESSGESSGGPAVLPPALGDPNSAGTASVSQPPSAGAGGEAVMATDPDLPLDPDDPDNPNPPVSVPNERVRILIETDAPGGDPDDEGSLVRFFAYTNEWDIEGLLATRSAEQSRTGIDGKQTLLHFIDAYETVYDNLVQHDSAYPEPASLRNVTKGSFQGNEARDLIIAAVDKDDPRPIWYANWGTNDGNLTGMRHALDYVRDTRTEAEYEAFIGKIYFSRDADRTYHVSEHIPFIPFWVDTRNPDRWYHRWEPLTANAGGFDIDRDVKNGHGALGALYTIQKEGDTPAFMYLVNVGLGDPLHPTWGSWGGRFSPRMDHWTQYNPEGFFWSDAQDSYDGSTSRDNTLARWAVHIQNDFAARMDWCVQPVSNANHPPTVVVNGSDGSGPVAIDAAPGQSVQLSAAGSADPDGDALSYEWVYYPEPGSFSGAIALDAINAEDSSFTLPDSVASGETVHVVLVVTDGGQPALTRYRRVVVTAR